MCLFLLTVTRATATWGFFFLGGVFPRWLEVCPELAVVKGWLYQGGSCTRGAVGHCLLCNPRCWPLLLWDTSGRFPGDNPQS